MTAMLEAKNLSVSYGKLTAVKDVSFAVEEGKIATIIGPNGAGKTTLLRALIGQLPASGSITYGGVDIGTLEVEARVEHGILLVPETRELFTDMVVADNLLLGAFTHRRKAAQVKQDTERVYELFPRLHERRLQLAGTLSGGERQMLAVARALMGKPALLMLDEPSLGLAPLVVRDIFKTIAGLRATGVTILLVEQNARAALEVADHGYVLEMGEIALDGPAAELARDPRVIETYLGAAQKKNAAA
jgi:branched-chain amino acid transport system ATP-binding protein